MSKSRDLNIDKNIFDVVSSARAPKLEPLTGWARVAITEGYEESTPKAYYPGVSFTQDWSNSTLPDDAPASWWHSDSGEVRLRGKVRSKNSGQVGTIFTLPEENAPEYDQEFICPIDDNGNIDLSSVRFRAWQEGDIET